MRSDLTYKLQKLQQNWLHGTVATAKWLKLWGISHELMNRYKKSNWVKSIGYGAFIRLEENVEWFGGLHALQFQLELDVHIGGKTALEMHGLSHYLSLGQPTIDILKPHNITIPQWFIKYPWPENVRVVEYNSLPPTIGIVDKVIENIPIKMSSRERATIELLQLAPRLYAFDEVPIFMDSLASLRGDVLNDLLLHCSSEKAKRLIVYFGEKLKHAWYKDIDQEALNIGLTSLKIVPNNGKYVSNYNLLLPKDYVIKDESEILY